MKANGYYNSGVWNTLEADSYDREDVEGRYFNATEDIRMIIIKPIKN